MAIQYTKDVMRDEILKYGYECGDHTYGRPNIRTWGEGKKLYIGRYCSIASGVEIFLGGNHRTDWITTYPFSALSSTWQQAAGIKGHPQSNGDVRIGNDVWLAYGCTIMSGVTIGDGAVVAAGSLVAKDVPAFALVGGNPAKIIRYRFDDMTISRLLEIGWWNWSEDRVRDVIPYLCSNNIQQFLLNAR